MEDFNSVTNHSYNTCWHALSTGSFRSKKSYIKGGKCFPSCCNEAQVLQGICVPDAPAWTGSPRKPICDTARGFSPNVRAVVAVYCVFFFFSLSRLTSQSCGYLLSSKLDVKSICWLWTWPLAHTYCTHIHTRYQKPCARSPYQHRSGSAKPLYWMADFQS